jgi:hypothetical protein
MQDGLHERVRRQAVTVLQQLTGDLQSMSFPDVSVRAMLAFDRPSTPSCAFPTRPAHRGYVRFRGDPMIAVAA